MDSFQGAKSMCSRDAGESLESSPKSECGSSGMCPKSRSMSLQPSPEVWDSDSACADQLIGWHMHRESRVFGYSQSQATTFTFYQQTADQWPQDAHYQDPLVMHTKFQGSQRFGATVGAVQPAFLYYFCWLCTEDEWDYACSCPLCTVWSVWLRKEPTYVQALYAQSLEWHAYLTIPRFIYLLF